MSTKNPALTPFKFEDSGREILIRRVSPYLVYELQKAFPEPKPPVQEVVYPGNVKKMEPNPQNPEYLAALAKYNQDFQDRMTRLIIKRGVEVKLTEEDQQEIQELRDFMKKEYEITLDPDNAMVYVLNICVGSDGDLDDLVAAIMRRSQPTEESVKNALSGFQGHV